MPGIDAPLYAAVFPFPELGDWDCEVYTALALAASGAVLELGCGTGRVLAAMRGAGADAYGVELDAAMVAQGRGRLAACGIAEPAAVLHHDDARTFSHARRYGLVALPDNSLPLFSDDADVVRMLERVRAHLSTDGHFVLDQALLHLEPHQRAWADRPIRVDDLPMTASARGEYDPATAIFTLSIVARAPGCERSMTLQLKQRPPEVLAQLLHQGGFTPVHPPIDERGQPLGAGSHMAITRARPR